MSAYNDIIREAKRQEREDIIAALRRVTAKVHTSTADMLEALMADAGILPDEDDEDDDW